MTDQAFKFVDDLLFYFPVVLAFLCSVACLFFRLTRDKLMHECALRLAADNKAAELRRLAEKEIEEEMRKKYFYNECPNCGSKPPMSSQSCPVCGFSLEVFSIKDVDPGKIHHLPSFR